MAGAVGSELELLRSLIDATRLLILIVDARGDVVRVNRSVEEVTGLPAAAFRTPIWQLATLPDERLRLKERFAPLKEEALPDGVLFHLAAAGNQDRVVDWTVKVIRDEAQAPIVAFAGVDLSQRLAAEERLSEAEELRHLVLNRIPAVVWMTDTELRFTFSAGGGLSSLGLGAGEVAVLGTSLYRYFHTNDPSHPGIAPHIRALRGESSTEEMLWNERVYQFRVEALRDRSQRIIGCIGIALDVTELAQAKRSQKRSEERIRNLVDANVIGVVMWDSEGRIQDANEAFLELVGYTREELLSGAISWREMTPAEYRHLDDRALAAMEATGKCTPYEKEYVAKGGVRVPVLIGAAPLRESGPGRQEGVAFILDLREQVRLRAARDESLAKEQNARLDTELANARLLLLVQGSRRLARTMTIDDTLTVLSELVVPPLADWSYVAHRGRNGGPWLVTAACSDPNKQALVRRLRAFRPNLEAPDGVPRLFRTGESAVYEEITPEQIEPRTAGWSVIGTRDPEHLAVIRELGMRSALCVPIRGRAGVDAVLMMVAASDPHRYNRDDVILAEDLAGRAAVALENGSLLAEALEAIEARDTFLSIAAHELRTPLTSLLLNLARLRRTAEGERPDPEAGLRGIKTAQAQGQRLSSLIDSLLDVAHVSRGRMTMVTEQVDIAQVVLETTTSMLPNCERAGCALDVAVSGKVNGTWDRARMEQVFTNLLANAVKFGARRPIEVRLEATAEIARISVRDHGIGLCHEDQTRIFNRFERAVSPHNYGGLGLGLYISSQILRSQGGSLRVESEPGQGACFIVELPRNRAPDDYPRPEGAGASSPSMGMAGP
jgi:PAS domain S-box-containing protein